MRSYMIAGEYIEHERCSLHSTCVQWKQCLESQAKELVPPSIYPFLKHQPTSHMLGQLIASRVMASRASWASFLDDVVHAAQVNVHISQGFFHSSLWYYVSMNYVSFANFRDVLCPDSWPFSKLNVCLHALGHGGLQRAMLSNMRSELRGGNIEARSYPGDTVGSECATGNAYLVNTTTLIVSYSICADVKKIAAYYAACLGGIFHAFFEHHDFKASGNTWTWPCDEHGTPAPAECFRWLFASISQGRQPDPTWVDHTTRLHALWMERASQFEASGGITVCTKFTSDLIAIPCIHGLSSVADGGHLMEDSAYSLPYAAYFTRMVRVPTSRPANLVDWCKAIVMSNDQSMDQKSAQERWITCAEGAMSFTTSIYYSRYGIPDRQGLSHGEGLPRVESACSTLLSRLV